jgi:hypothetical protein
MNKFGVWAITIHHITFLPCNTHLNTRIAICITFYAASLSNAFLAATFPICCADNYAVMVNNGQSHLQTLSLILLVTVLTFLSPFK